MSLSAGGISDRESFNADLPSLAQEVNCPVCGSPCAGEPLYRYTAEQAAAHFCPPTRDKDRNRRLQECIRALWQDKVCQVLQCTTCGFAFGHPFVSGNEEFYSILHEQRDYPTWRWDYDVAFAEAVQKFTGGRILDIGAGVGMFLRRLSADWECCAVEGSSLTRRDLEANGVKVFQNLSEAVPHNRGTFQVITLFQVLEHIAQFETLLSQCHELLTPEGRLVVTVPDGDAMIRQERLTGCADMPPNHINKWSVASLLRVLTQSGFECSQPIFEPPSWKNLKTNLHMRVAADATERESLAAQAYRIQTRFLRRAALSLLAGPALLQMLPNRRQLMLGGAFAIIGVKRG